MKRDDLKKLGLTDDAVIDAIMEAHGKDVEKMKSSVETSKTEADTLRAQLTEANTAIEGFKKLDVDGIKAAADDWKAKYEQAQTESAAQILKVKQDHALERDLKETYKVKDLVAVKAHLKSDDLKYNEKDDTFIGLKEQIEPIKTSYGSYFDDFVPPPALVAGANNQPVTTDAFLAAMRKGAQIPEAKG